MVGRDHHSRNVVAVDEVDGGVQNKAGLRDVRGGDEELSRGHDEQDIGISAVISEIFQFVDKEGTPPLVKDIGLEFSE